MSTRDVMRDQLVSSSLEMPAASKQTDPDPLKGGDVYKWAIEQAALIRTGRFDQVDWVNVADEIEDVGKSEFRTLTSNIAVVLVHLLKWDHQPERRSRSWIFSIREHRGRFSEDLADNPSLKARLDEAVARAYRSARLTALKETGLDESMIPEGCPYDWGTISKRSFVLDQTDKPS